MLSEEEIMQLQEAQESVAFEERTEEPVEVKKKKPLLGRLRKRRRENDHNIDENEKTHQEIICDSDTHGRHKEESIEMDEIPDIPSVADIKAAEKNDVTVHAPSDEDRRPVVSEPPRIAEFFVPDDETDGEGSGRESMDSELPLVSHYMERMDFEGKDDSDDEPVLK